MKSKQIGNIPERIVYIDRAPSEYTREFEDGTKIGEPIIASSSFPSDASNAKTIKTGISWASTESYYGGSKKVEVSEEEAAKSTDRYGIFYDDGKWWKWEHERLTKAKRHIPKQEEVPNEPFTGARILSLEHRSQGGRAYKVYVQGRVFDLREDVLLDIMLNSKIDNGLIACSLIWGKFGSQMKLIRVGSELHKQLEDSMQLSSEMKVPSELVYGGVYANKKDTFIYLGQHKYVSYIAKEDEKHNRYSYSNTPTHPLSIFLQK